MFTDSGERPYILRTADAISILFAVFATAKTYEFLEARIALFSVTIGRISTEEVNGASFFVSETETSFFSFATFGTFVVELFFLKIPIPLRSLVSLSDHVNRFF